MRKHFARSLPGITMPFIFILVVVLIFVLTLVFLVFFRNTKPQYWVTKPRDKGRGYDSRDVTRQSETTVQLLRSLKSTQQKKQMCCTNKHYFNRQKALYFCKLVPFILCFYCFYWFVLFYSNYTEREALWNLIVPEYSDNKDHSTLFLLLKY